MFARWSAFALVTCVFHCAASFGTGVAYYVLQGVDKTQSDQVIADDRVSGFTIRVSWRMLHEEGFDWLDQQMARGEQLDRDIQLRVMAGNQAPPDLPNVSYFQHADNDGTIDTAPVPWDPDLPVHWQHLVDQLETRYADNPRLKLVHLPGFASSSEMHTPDEITTVPGYSSQALAEAWIAMSQPLIEAFSTVPISLNYATPFQANLDATDSQWVLDQIVALAGDRAGFQANDLSALVELDRNKYETLVDLKQQGHAVGFQMLSISTAARFGGEFEEAVETGLSAGAEWLEFYSPDLPEIPIAGDYNFDGIVNLADYVVWRDNLGSQLDLRADGTGNLIVDAADYQFWKTQFALLHAGAIATSNIVTPEPQTTVVAALAICSYALLRIRGHFRQ